MIQPAGVDTKARYAAVKRVTLIGSWVDLILGVLKIGVGWMAQSQALIADGIHSLSDLGTDLMVLAAAQHAQREADEEHPYGHGRIETLAVVGLGTSLILIGIGIGYDAGRRLFEPALLWQPTVAALWVAAISVVAKEAIYQYTVRQARRLRSELLRANAWHSRTDAISSLFVIAGVGGSLAGLDYVDAIAAIAVAVMVAKIGWSLAWSSARELMDTGLESARLEAIREAILAVDGVAALHMLRTRRMAGNALVDVHIILENPRLSVSEGHQISETVRARLIERIDEVADVTVHIDPEDDELYPPAKFLPLRRDALRALDEAWSGVAIAEHIEETTLHYLDGRLHVDVVVPKDALEGFTGAAQSPSDLEAALNDAVSSLDDIARVRLLVAS